LSKIEHKFHTLTPKTDADLNIYESALNSVFEDKHIKNIAISGAYGSGKSSVIESYKNQYSNRKFLHISLTNFRNESVENEDENYKLSTTNNAILEGKILNQLIHQIPAKKIPLTNFRVKKDSTLIKNTEMAILSTFILGLVIYIFYFSANSETQFAAFAGFLLLVGVFIYQILSHNLLKKATIKGLEIEIFQDSEDSYFDKYLNEVLYLFKNVEEDAIIFEDIDRYGSSKIFERLHEINRLVNNNRKCEFPLRFFYLMRDDIFTSKDRTKFFDLIIPIVPVVDGSNAFDNFLECFEYIGITINNEESKLNNEFLQGISLYIDDMRLLRNICNEFLIYNNIINTPEQNENKMLALIIYKNLFPSDFAKLQLGRGFMFEIIGGRGKERLIESELNWINAEIESNNNELESVKAEFLTADDLAILYGYKKFSKSYNIDDWNADKFKEKLESLEDYDDIKIEYKKRLENSTESTEIKANRISNIEQCIANLNENKSTLQEKSLINLLTRKNIDNFFKETNFTSETGISEKFKNIKDSPYFAMLKYLVREGYIDETYPDYMTYFYGISLKEIDKIFLRSVTDQKRKNESYKLENLDLVVSRLHEKYFSQEETLNFALFPFLLEDFLGEQKYTAKTKRLIKQIRDNNLYDFLERYFVWQSKIDNLVKVIGNEWTNFLSGYFIYLGIDTPKGKYANDIFAQEYVLKLLILIGENAENISFIDEESKNKMQKYVSNEPYFMCTKSPNIAEIAIGIKEIGVKFGAIPADCNPNLLTIIYENCSYAINYNNIIFMLKYFYLEKFDYATSNSYRAIMSDENSPLAKYVNENINDYIDVILETCNGIINDLEKYSLAIINNTEILAEKRVTYISYLNTAISDVIKVDDKNLWEELLKNHKAIECTANNILAYFAIFGGEKLYQILINFINAKGANIIFDNAFADDQQKEDFFHAVVLATELDNSIYEEYLSQFNLAYEEFEVDNLPIKKLAILDKLNKIGMTIKSLDNIRNKYPEYLYIFICNHINDYLEMLSEIDKDIFAKDFEYLISNYDKFEQQTRAVIFGTASEKLNLLKTLLHKYSRLLITEILSQTKFCLTTSKKFSK